MCRHENSIYVIIYSNVWPKFLSQNVAQLLSFIQVICVLVNFRDFCTKKNPLWYLSICHLSWRSAALQEGCTYLSWDRCVQNSASTGMMMENLIITAIFIRGKYNFGWAILNLSVAPSSEHRDLSRKTGMAFRSCAFTVKLLRYSGL